MKQHEIALIKANAIRSDQARLRRENRARSNGESRRWLAAAILDPDETVGRMKLCYALRCAWRLGDHQARRLLLAAGVATYRSNARVRDLTERERRAIADELLRRGAR